MGEIIKIPLTGGFDKQSDTNVVGTGFTKLVNVHNLQRGVFKVRKGYGTPDTISDRNFLDFNWWIEPVSGTLYWIGYDYNGNKQIFRLDINFSNNTNLESITTDAPNRVHIYNYGNAVRIAKGIKHNASVYQKIDRDYFNNGLSYLHWQFSDPLDTGEKITLIDSAGLSKTYVSTNCNSTTSDNGDFRGATVGGAKAYIEITSTTINGLIYTIRGLKADGSILERKYKFDGSEATGSSDGEFVFVNTNGTSGSSVTNLGSELSEAIQSSNGHNGLISAMGGTSGKCWLRQTVAGTGGHTTINEGGSNTGSGNINGSDPNDFHSGSSDTDIIVANLKNGSARTASQMAGAFKTSIEFYNGHNGTLSVTKDVASDGVTALTGGVYVRQGIYDSVIGTTVTVSGGFNDDCTVNPSATFTTGIGYEFNDFYYDPINYPRIQGISLGNGAISDGGVLPFTTSARNIHYKIAPIFDGVQEGLMSESVIGPLATSQGDQTNTVSFTIDIDETELNPRLSGLNIYRAITTGEYPGDGDYYFIDTIDVTSGPKTSFVNTNLAFIGRRLVSAWDTDDFKATFGVSDKYSANWSQTVIDSSGTSTLSSFTASPVTTASRYFEADVQDKVIGHSSFESDATGNQCPENNTDKSGYKGIKYVASQFVLLSDNTYADRFNENKFWMIARNWFYNSDADMVARGALLSGDCASLSGWTVSNGSEDDSSYDSDTPAEILDDADGGGDWYFQMLGQQIGTGGDDGREYTGTPLYYIENTNPLTGFSGGEYFILGTNHTFIATGAVESSDYFKIEAVDWTSGSAGSTITLMHDTTSSNGHKDTHFQIPDAWTALKIKLTINVPAEGSDDSDSTGDNFMDSWYHESIFRMHRLGLWEVQRHGSKIWHHQSMFAVENAEWNTDINIGKTLNVGASKFSIASNAQEVARVVGDAGWSSLSEGDSQNISLSGGEYQWTSSGGSHRVTVYDAGKGATVPSPLSGVTSLDTRYKVSATVNGRTFGGNVNLFNKLEDSNAYDDMLVYSELQQPDVIPISNYIRLNDLQGGAIVGMAGLMSDLVVFAERGIFRLNVPSSDPTGWSLVESEPNLGCTQPYSIKQWKNGVFFAGTDNIYYITPNFEFISISENWRDEYQSVITNTTDTNQTVIEIDNNNERLLVKYGSEDEAMNIMDLNAFAQQKLIWYEYSSRVGDCANEGDIDSLVARNDSKVYIVNITDGGADTKIRELEPSVSQGTAKYTFRTGYISLSSMTDKEDLFVRRINFNLQQSSANCDIKVWLNHGINSNGVTDVNGGKTISKSIIPSISGQDNMYSVRIGARAKGLQIQLKHSIAGEDTTVLRELEIEVD